MPATDPAFDVLPRDLSAYKAGNTSIDYVHRFDSGVDGPHVMVNALTHGNEFCGMVAACHLLDNNVRPKIGTLTVSFANVAAYQTFDPVDPFASRQITHNLNRVWSTDELDGDQDSAELRRARALRPAVEAADHILDIHSTSEDVAPFWVYPHFARNTAVAGALPQPAIHLVMPNGLGSGTPLMQYGRHGRHDGPGAALVVECGQHFKQATADLAVAVTYNFLAHFGMVDQPRAAAQPHRRFELLRTHVITSTAFAFTRPVVGFETYANGERIATDGDLEIIAPCDNCTIFMPARKPIVGQEGVYLTRPLQ